MPPRHDGAPRTAKYQEALDGGHDVLVLVSEVWGGFSPEAVRFLGELAQARGDRVDFERPHSLLDVRGLRSVDEWSQSLSRGAKALYTYSTYWCNT